MHQCLTSLRDMHPLVDFEVECAMTRRIRRIRRHNYKEKEGEMTQEEGGKDGTTRTVLLLDRDTDDNHTSYFCDNKRDHQ